MLNLAVFPAALIGPAPVALPNTVKPRGQCGFKLDARRIIAASSSAVFVSLVGSGTFIALAIRLRLQRGGGWPRSIPSSDELVSVGNDLRQRDFTDTGDRPDLFFGHEEQSLWRVD